MCLKILNSPLIQSMSRQQCSFNTLVSAGPLLVNVRPAPQQMELSAMWNLLDLPAERYVLEIMGNLVTVQLAVLPSKDITANIISPPDFVDPRPSYDGEEYTKLKSHILHFYDVVYSMAGDYYTAFVYTTCLRPRC